MSSNGSISGNGSPAHSTSNSDDSSNLGSYAEDGSAHSNSNSDDSSNLSNFVDDLENFLSEEEIDAGNFDEEEIDAGNFDNLENISSEEEIDAGNFDNPDLGNSENSDSGANSDSGNSENPDSVAANSDSENSATDSEEECAHIFVRRGNCVFCGHRAIVIGKTLQELRRIIFSDGHIFRLRDAETNSLLQSRKLYLIIEVDDTLLNYTHRNRLTPIEEYIVNEGDAPIIQQRDVRPEFEGADLLIKLRHGSRMARALDPQQEFFNDSVIIPDAVLGRDTTVLILVDDAEEREEWNAGRPCCKCLPS